MYAGILPYYIDSKGAVWLLLGRERQSLYRDSLKWGGFGGLVERNESIIDAAAREGYEESMGVFGTESELRAQLSSQHSFPKRSRSARHYLLRMAEKDTCLPLYFERFYRYAHQCSADANQPLPMIEQGGWEKCQIAWIPLKEAQTLDKEMRPAFLRDIRQVSRSDFVV